MLIKYFTITNEQDVEVQFKNLSLKYANSDPNILKQIVDEKRYISLNRDKIFSKEFKHIFNVSLASDSKDSQYPLKLYSKTLKDLHQECVIANFKPTALVYKVIENANNNKYLLTQKHFEMIAKVLEFKDGWAYFMYEKYKKQLIK